MGKRIDLSPDGWPRPQHYSIYCPLCGKPAAALVYDPPHARYLHYSRGGEFWHGVRLEDENEPAARG